MVEIKPAFWRAKLRVRPAAAAAAYFEQRTTRLASANLTAAGAMKGALQHESGVKTHRAEPYAGG
jgi:hypothetical protein